MTRKKQLEKLYRVKPRQGRGDYLRLDMNENPEGLPKDFFDNIIKKITPQMLAMYPETDILVNELANYLSLNYENIFLTNGSDDAIKAVFEVFGCENKKVVSVCPTFQMYAIYSSIYNMHNSTAEYDDKLELKFESLINLIDKDTVIVSLLNPNNPIGSVYTNEQVEKVIEKSRDVGAVVVIDEAYHYFHNESFIDCVSKYDNVILLRTFSKLCSIAGLRIGYVVGNPQVIGLLKKVKPSYIVNCVAIQFALEIIRDKDLINNLILIEKDGREFIINKIKEFCRDYYARNGNYVFIKCKKSAEDVRKELEKRKILVKTYDSDILRNYIRITTGSRQVMEIFWNEFYSVDF